MLVCAMEFEALILKAAVGQCKKMRFKPKDLRYAFSTRTSLMLRLGLRIRGNIEKRGSTTHQSGDMALHP
jgi:hypothetical protein